MSKKVTAALSLLSCFVLVWVLSPQAVNAADKQANVFEYDMFKITIGPQHKKIEPGGELALVLQFELEKDWYFYASKKTAPGGMNLKVIPTAQNAIRFSSPILPKSEIYVDKVFKRAIEIFTGIFTVLLPFSIISKNASAEAVAADAKIAIQGAYCSALQCRIIRDLDLDAKITVAEDTVAVRAKLSSPQSQDQPTAKVTETASPSAAASYSVWYALPLALLAGLSLNIMPCVWPVLPIIVMRIVDQAKHSKRRSVTMGLAFCFGILLFFGCLAAINIVLQVFYGTVLQWGDQFRNPAFVAGMSILLIVMALFMFGLFTVSLPSAIAGKTGSGKGHAGSVGMGFLAAILSTPCSFAILAAAFAWAQAQHWLLGSIAIMVIGVGMAVPYAILTSMPGLLKDLPKAGRWMELFKQAIGFVLLIIAVKLVVALPQVRQTSVLYFSVVLAFCVWMWGSWVDYNTPAGKKYFVRIIAVALAVIAGWAFLPEPPPELIDWQPYDRAVINDTLEQKKPVLIKFTADWCFNCEIAEKIVYSRKDIAELIDEKGVLAIKADTTANDFPATKDLKNLYSEPGVPVSMLFVPGSNEPVRWRGMFFADELKNHLKEIPAE